MLIRPIGDDDAQAVLALNEESVWALSPLDDGRLITLRAQAAHALLVELDGQVAGFAVAYAPGSAYDSINYAWHAERFDSFLYLDRIAVASAFRRRGVATALYDEMELNAKEQGRMVCEVYSDPPNVESLAFHAARGYREIGSLRQTDGKVTVMLEKPL
jgi:uncharacterized protein